MIYEEPNSSVQRTITLAIKPTVTEIVDAIWNMFSEEQVVLLGCLARRFCHNEKGLMQLASISNTLSVSTKDRADAAKLFVKTLADYILDDSNSSLQGEKCDTKAED